MLNLKARRAAAAYSSDEPTLTDQSAASQTDLNIIVNQFLKTGQSNSQSIPRYGDFTQLPQDLRGIIESSRSVTKLRAQLPAQLQALSVQQLIGLTAEQIRAMLQPPAEPPKETKETPKP